MLTSVVEMLLLTGTVMHPALPPRYGADAVETLKERVATAMTMSPKELYDLVPAATGMYFIGCPNCHGGAQENGVFEYSLDMGDRVKCRFCGMMFPNEQFPNNRERVITGPRTGIQQVYRWHEDADGHQYFFEAHAWWHRWRWTQDMALYLAHLYHYSGDTAYSDRAAAIIGRFAQVYPDYPVRFDYPYRPKQFFPADQKAPHGDVGAYRGAKFYWWGYGDLPDTLVRAYDLVATSDSFDRLADLLGADIRQRIDNDLIRLGYEFATAHKDSYSNMSPGMYTDMIAAGRVIGEPAMVHEAVKRFRTLMSEKFFFDGWWCEGAPSYHAQTVGNLLNVAETAKGYSDPEDYAGQRFDNLDLESQVPLLQEAVAVGWEGVLPDGRMIPINDTWANQKRKPLAESAPRLWSGLGHAALGAGKDAAQFQVHLNWSGAFGHSHADNGSIILFAHGKELLSDLGYTHTKYRNWTVNTASHNAVVVDERSQEFGSKSKPTTGNLLHYDDRHPQVRWMDLDASPAYPQCSVYRRRIIHVHADAGRDYVVDVFDVEGGKTHDWFLHGSADEEGVLETGVPFDTPVETLVPEWGGRGVYESELDLDTKGERFHAYGFLRDIVSAPAHGPWTATWRYGEGGGLRSHLFPQEGTTLYRFAAPAIRGAQELDANLDKHRRHGILQRRVGGPSRFIAVHEPFAAQPWLDEVRLDGDTLTVRYGDAEDTLTLADNGIEARSTAGWRYDSGEPATLALAAVERGETFAFKTDQPAPKASFARVNFPGDRTFVYRVANVEGDRVVLADDPGFEYDPAAQQARFGYFPQEIFTGPVTLMLW
jgi:hypothetical protein